MLTPRIDREPLWTLQSWGRMNGWPDTLYALLAVRSGQVRPDVSLLFRSHADVVLVPLHALHLDPVRSRPDRHRVVLRTGGELRLHLLTDLREKSCRSASWISLKERLNVDGCV